MQEFSKRAFIIITISVIAATYCYAQEYYGLDNDRRMEQEMEEFQRKIRQEMESSDVYGSILSKGTTKEEVLDILGYPDEKKKNFWLGQEIWYYENIIVNGIEHGSNCFVFEEGRVVSTGYELMPEWGNPLMATIKTVFFPLYILSKIPGFALLQIPIVFFSLLGAFLFKGWGRFFCIYFFIGSVIVLMIGIFDLFTI